MEEIIPYINSRFVKESININSTGIKKILQSLVKKKIIVEGSVLTRKELLDNEKRENIFRLVKKHPGIIFHELVRKSHFSNYIVYWHLKMLMRFQCIKTTTIGKHQIFFVSSVKLEDAELEYFKSKEKSKQIITFLRDNDIGVSKTQISRELNMHINTAIKYLNNLVRLKILEEKPISNKSLYFLNENYF